MKLNIIIISLTRAKDRVNVVNETLSKVGDLSNVYVYPAFDGQNITNETFSVKINMPGYCYLKGNEQLPAQVGCTLSHVGVVSMAKALKWDYVIVLEDDIHICDDFVKRIEYLLKHVPNDWEHIYLSGIPHLTNEQKNDPLFLKYMSITPGMWTDTTFGYILKNTAYEKVITQLSSFGTAVDDMLNKLIHEDKKMKSYIFFPFVTQANLDIESATALKKMPDHPSSLYFRNNILK